MSIIVEATYEDGVLKPKQPLPLNERERVELIVRRAGILADQTYGMIGFSGAAADFDRLLEESESELMEHA
jgi:predicted DNA-binding antitoxin AbrB/MazE fold protein